MRNFTISGGRRSGTLNTKDILSAAARFATSVIIGSKKQRVDVKIWELEDLKSSVTDH